ncbi:MAG: VWA domain-containing protein [Candidatus Sumerlaeia bacterium]
MDFRVASPLYLLLLLMLPLVWWWTVRLGGVPPIRRWVIRGLRTAVVVLLILALAEVELVHRSRELTVFFVVDQSDSIPTEKREAVKNYIRLAAGRTGMNDKTGLIVFGAEPSIEAVPRRGLDLEEIKSVVDTRNSNIASALRLAIAAFPRATQKRIVLISDGNENIGSASDVASTARNAGIVIDVLPVEYGAQPDVIVEKVQVPQNVFAGAPFEIKTFVSTPEYKKGRLRLYQNGTLLAEDEVELLPDRKNIFSIQHKIPAGGFYSIQAAIETEGDPCPQNNTAYAFTDVVGEPSVLYIEGDQTVQNVLNRALRVNGIAVTVRGVDGIPPTLEELQNFDALIFSNVHASNLSRQQMKMIQTAVRDLGIGFIMIGGENSFGAGGYNDTPIEEALPVEMEIKARKVLPNGALAIILHTCEFPEGNTYAREITLAALDVLSSRDYFGVLEYSWRQAQADGTAAGAGMVWVVPLGLVGNKIAQRRAIQAAQPEDMPDFTPGMQMALKELSAVKAQTKHMIIISDGDPQRPSPQLVNAIKNAGITISTIAVWPHSPSDTKIMETIANMTGGRYYFVKNPNELPKIFIKEASTVRRPLIVEEPTVVKLNQYSEAVAGFAADEFPMLQGYVLTEKKELAVNPLLNDKGDVILSHWQYGLGRTVAYTSDVRPKWASSWVAWPRFDEFWARLVRFVLLQAASPNFQVSTSTEGSMGRVVVDAIGEDGGFLNFLSFEGRAVTPDLQNVRFTLRQVAPGRYLGEFPISMQGSYLLSLVSVDQQGGQQLIRSGLAVSYSPEYVNTKSNEPLLEQLAAITGGRKIDAGSSADLSYIFSHNLPSGDQPEPLFPWLLAVAAVLFLFDIFARRVFIEWAEVRAWAAGVAASLMPRRREVKEERLAALLEAKKRATSDQESDRAVTPSKPHVAQRGKQAIEVAGVFQESRAEADAGRVPTGPGPVAAGEPKPQVPARPAAASPLDTSGREPPAVENTTTSRLLEIKRRRREKK